MATLSQITTDPALETHLFWDQYKTTIIAVVLVLVLGGLGYGGYQLYNAQQANNAMALLTAARSPEQYQQVINRYPGRGRPRALSAPCGGAAGEEKLHGSERDAAQVHRSVSETRLDHHRLDGRGGESRSLGKNDEALSTYQRLASEYPQSFNAPLALLAQVPLMKAKNRNDEARRVCETSSHNIATASWRTRRCES